MHVFIMNKVCMLQVQCALYICNFCVGLNFYSGVYMTYLQQDMHFTSKISFFLSFFILITGPNNSIASIQFQYGQTSCISLDLFETLFTPCHTTSSNLHIMWEQPKIFIFKYYCVEWMNMKMQKNIKQF